MCLIIMILIDYRLVGYDGTVCEQPWTVPLTLKLLVVVPPIIFILIALSFLHFYPITSKTIPRTKCLLDEKRQVMIVCKAGGHFKLVIHHINCLP